MSSTLSFTLRLRSRSLVPASPTICVIFFMVRMSTRTPSPSKLESVGWWMLVSTTVVSTRMRRPSVKPWLCATVTILGWICLITPPPSATPQRLGVGRLRAAHAGEVAVHQIGAYLALEHAIAPVADVLEDQQPQHHLR